MSFNPRQTHKKNKKKIIYLVQFLTTTNEGVNLHVKYDSRIRWSEWEPSSDSLSSSPVSSSDLVSYQKSHVFLSGHREKYPDTDDLKEGMLLSCLSSSNLRGNFLSNTLRGFQKSLETRVLTGDTRNDALSSMGGEEAACPPAQEHSKLLSPTCLFQHLKSFLLKTRQVGIPHLLRHREATGLSILALIPQLPGDPAVSSNSCLGLPRVCWEWDKVVAATSRQSWETTAFTLPMLLFSRGRESEVQRGKATWS